MAPENGHGIDELNRFAMDVIQRAGQEALGYYGRGRANLKFDEELVIEAELHLVNYFQEQIQAQFPDHLVFVTDQVETEYSHDGKRYMWIFDPIDGVDNFQTGIPIWGMSVALLENFWPIFGFFHMPSTGDLFHAIAGQAAYQRDRQLDLSGSGSVDDESILLTYSRFHQEYQVRFPGKIRNLGSTAAHICYVAMGRADAAIIANESFRDLAASRVIIESAGGKLFNLDGTGFFLNEYLDGKKIDSPLIVTAEEKLTAVLECIEEKL